MSGRTDLTRCGACKAEVIAAVTALNDRSILLDVDPVPADTPGAFTLMGSRAFSRRAPLEDHLAGRGADAINPADYPTHRAHIATCPKREITP